MSNHSRLILGILILVLAGLLFCGKAHAATDTTRFRPGPNMEKDGDAPGDPTFKVANVSEISVGNAGGDADTVAQNLVAAIKSSLDPAVDGLTINSVSYSGDVGQAGVFTGGKDAGLDFEQGIILSTGYALDAVNGLHYSNIATDRSFDLNGAGDQDLFLLNKQVSGDAAVLTINFTPNGDYVTFRFRFASEEWPTNWVFAKDYYYYDVFGFFLNGINWAVIPETQTPVGIHSIYPAGVVDSPNYPEGSNTDLYVNNTHGGSSSVYGDDQVGVAYNGLTKVLAISAPVIANQPNTIKIAMGDASDRNYDSVVFIEAHTFRINHIPTLDNPLPDQVTVAGKPFSCPVPGNTFSDQDPGDTLTYSAALSDGSPLPSWLSFDTSTMAFSGTPSSSDVGTLSVRVKAVDTAMTSANDTFLILVMDRPSVGTQAPTKVTGHSAVGRGIVTATGGSNPTVRGFCWATHANPTTSDSRTVEKGSFGTGSFTGDMTGLKENITYHVRAYATNVVGTAYGEEVTFTAKAIPPKITNITTTVPDGAYNAGRRIPLTIGFSVPVSSKKGLTISLNSGVSFSTGALANQTSYSWTYTVGPGENSPRLDASDIKGTIINADLSQTVDPVPQQNLSASKTIVIDTVAPTAAVSYSSPDPYGFGKVVTLTAAFSEPMLDSPVVKISISGANTVRPTDMTKIDSTHYTYVHTAGAGSGTATVVLSTGTDPAGNPIHPVPTRGADFEVESTSPTVTLASKAPDPTSESPIPVSVTFSEPVKGFTVEDVIIANGTAGHFAGTGSNYTLEVTPEKPGKVTIDIAPNVAFDRAGNGNQAALRLKRTYFRGPSISGTVSGQKANDTDLISPFASVVIKYAEKDRPLAVRMKLDSAAKGTFTEESLRASGFKPGAQGAYDINATAIQATTALRKLVFAPARVPRNQSVTAIFTLSADDGLSPSAVDNSTTLLISWINHAPVAYDQSVRQEPGEPLTIRLKATDEDDDPLKFILVSPPADGTLTGSFPKLRYTCTSWQCDSEDSFTYKVNDGVLDSNVAKVSLVSNTARVPRAFDQSVATPGNKPLVIVLVGSDRQGVPLEYKVVDRPTRGKLSGKGPRLVYTPMEGYLGQDSLTFKVSNGSRDSGLAFVSITIGGPVADAGPDQEAGAGEEVVLDGSNSFETNGQIQFFKWTQKSGTPVDLESSTVARTVFMAPAAGPGGESLVFDLEVMDGSGLKSSDHCIVNIVEAHKPPRADAGAEQVVDEGERVMLKGSSSSAETGIASCLWTQIQGKPVTLSSRTTANPVFKAPQAGAGGQCLAFLLRVTDKAGLISEAQTLVNIVSSGKPPKASAGRDQTASGGEVVVLDASDSHDPSGNVLTFRWTQLSGPPVGLSNPTAVKPTFTTPHPDGIENIRLTFQLTAINREGLWSRDICAVTVKQGQ